MAPSIGWSVKAFVVATVCAAITGFKAESLDVPGSPVVYASAIIAFVGAMGICAAMKLIRWGTK